MANGNGNNGGANQNAAQATAQAATAPPFDSTTHELLARLEAAEKQVSALKAENESLAQQATLTNRRIRSEAAPFAPEPGSYVFRIGPVDREKHPDLPVVTQRACDESEMIRWYCATHEEKKGSGKQLDPVRVHLKVECIDKRRSQLIVLDQRLGAIRHKIAAGGQLTKEDQELVARFEAKIFQFPEGSRDGIEEI